MNNRKYPIGIQNFEKIRKENFLYVDKTDIIARIVNSGNYFFLSRPRRFGKSLLLSTLHAYFDGRKDLFEGLAIADIETAWKKLPVLHLDLNTENYNSSEALLHKLDAVLSDWEALYGRNPVERSVATRFEGVIKRAYQHSGERVVILVDEYDKPLLQAIGNEQLQDDYRKTLKAFYGALKSDDQYIRFAFLMGFTKFGKISIFSDLNNLTDLSMDWRYYNICGISTEELHEYFAPDIEQLALENKMSVGDATEKLRRLYDGYHFTEESPGLYNPYSLLNTFDRMRFGSYWFETGTPSFLVYLLKQHHYNLEQMTREQTTAEVLDSIDVMSSNPIPVIYQSGYLTIKDYDPRFKLYLLGFPNEEVEEGFKKTNEGCIDMIIMTKKTGSNRPSRRFPRGFKGSVGVPPSWPPLYRGPIEGGTLPLKPLGNCRNGEQQRSCKFTTAANPGVAHCPLFNGELRKYNIFNLLKHG